MKTKKLEVNKYFVSKTMATIVVFFETILKYVINSSVNHRSSEMLVKYNP